MSEKIGKKRFLEEKKNKWKLAGYLTLKLESPGYEHLSKVLVYLTKGAFLRQKGVHSGNVNQAGDYLPAPKATRAGGPGIAVRLPDGLLPGHSKNYVYRNTGARNQSSLMLL